MAPKVSDSVEQLRAAGNQNFRNGQYGEASALYERALRLLQARGRNPPRVSPLRACVLHLQPRTEPQVGSAFGFSFPSIQPPHQALAGLDPALPPVPCRLAATPI